jgi:heme oxygenase
MYQDPIRRSQRLNQITRPLHERLDKAVKAYAPFDTLASYTRFLTAQYLFQQEIRELYTHEGMIDFFADLPERCRAEQAKADLNDLDLPVPPMAPGAVDVLDEAETLGWLFVSEGSKLGAAFLIKRAAALNLSETFGARHLREPVGGRAEGWKRFIRIFDEMALNEEQELSLVQGAIAAFERFSVLLDHAYSQAAETERT